MVCGDVLNEINRNMINFIRIPEVLPKAILCWIDELVIKPISGHV
jgi:hypothetical protein